MERTDTGRIRSRIVTVVRRETPLVGAAQRALVGRVTLDDVLALLAEQLRAMCLAVETRQLQERRARR
jgi:hypothetical protein